jgi:hypothetical protein
MVLLAPRQRFSAVLVKVIKIYAQRPEALHNLGQMSPDWFRSC